MKNGASSAKGLASPQKGQSRRAASTLPARARGSADVKERQELQPPLDVGSECCHTVGEPPLDLGAGARQTLSATACGSSSNGDLTGVDGAFEAVEAPTGLRGSSRSRGGTLDSRAVATADRGVLIGGRGAVPGPAQAFDFLAMVRNRGGREPAPPPPRSAHVGEDRPHGERARGPADTNERQERQPPLDVGTGAWHTLGATAGGSSSSGGLTVMDSAIPAPTIMGCSSRGGTLSSRAAAAADRGLRAGGGIVSDRSPAFDILTMVRNRGSEPAPLPPPPPPPPPSPPPLTRWAHVVVHRPDGELARGPADVNERQERQPLLDVKTETCHTAGATAGGSSSSGGVTVIDRAIPAPTGLGGSTRGETLNSGATAAADRGLRGGRGAVSDQLPAFDVLTMVRNRGSEPAPPPPPPPPPPPRSVDVGEDRPHGGRARGPADVNERQERQPLLDVKTEDCHTTGATAGGSASNGGLTVIDRAIPTPTGLGGSSRGGTLDSRAATAADRGLRGGGGGAVSNQSPPFDFLTMVRSRGSEPAPPPPPRSAHVVVHRPHGELARGPADVDERQGRQPPLDVGAGSCHTAGATAGGSSSNGDLTVIDRAIPATNILGSRGGTLGSRTTTAPDRGLRRGRGAVSDQSPAFDILAMVRNLGSEPTPPPPPPPPPSPPRSAHVVVHRPHGELARGTADVDERQERQPLLDVGAGSCHTAGATAGGSSSNGDVTVIDRAIPAPTGLGGSSRGGTLGSRAATAADCGLQRGWEAVSDQSPAFDILAMVRNRGSEPAPPPPPPPLPPRWAHVGEDRPQGELARGLADVNERQERKPLLDVKTEACDTIDATTGGSSSNGGLTVIDRAIPAPTLLGGSSRGGTLGSRATAAADRGSRGGGVTVSDRSPPFDILTMVRSRGSEPAPPPQPPPRSAHVVVDRPHGERARGPADTNERQERQPPLDMGTGAWHTFGATAGGSSSSKGLTVINSAIPAPTILGGSSRGDTLGSRAATAPDRGLRGGGEIVSDQSPAFDFLTMVRNRGSEPPPRSAHVGEDRPHGELARGPADVNERQERKPPLDVDAGSCHTVGATADGSSSSGGLTVVDRALPAPTGLVGSNRGGTLDGRVATAADRGLRRGRGAVSNQSPPFDFLAMIRNRGGREPPPPPPRSADVEVDRPHGELARGADPVAASAGRGFGGSGVGDTAAMQLLRNCHFCGRPGTRKQKQERVLWVCGGKCGRWACGTTKCSCAMDTCCFCDEDARIGCQCFNCKRKRKRKADRPRCEKLAAIRATNMGAHPKSWNSFVLPPTLADPGGVPASVYSVCGTRCGSRVLVVINGEHTICTRDSCNGVCPAVDSGNEDGGKIAMDFCEHGEAARKVQASQSTSVRLHAEEDLLELAMEVADAGVLELREVNRIMTMYRAATDSGVPLVAKLGDTGYYVVRDGDNRYFPAGWAHVLYDGEGVAGAAARNRRTTVHRDIVCKAFKGGPCYEAKKKETKVCIHTHVVALVVKGSGYGGTATGEGPASAPSVDGEHLFVRLPPCDLSTGSAELP